MSQLRLHRFLGPEMITIEDHTSIDFDRQLSVRLEKRRTFDKGQRIRTDRYDPAAVSLDPGTGQVLYDDDGLIISIEYTFIRDDEYLVLTRPGTVTWWCEDGTAHHLTKSLLKTYSGLERMKEGITRRRNVIDQLKIDVLGSIMITEGISQSAAIDEGKLYFNAYQDETDIYIESDSDALVVATMADTTFNWLNNDMAAVGAPGVTIRQYIAAGMGPPGA